MMTRSKTKSLNIITMNMPTSLVAEILNYVGGLKHVFKIELVFALNSNNKWIANGLRHNDSKHPPDNGKWYAFGKLHYDNGPAISYADGTKEFWRRGVFSHAIVPNVYSERKEICHIKKLLAIGERKRDSREEVVFIFCKILDYLFDNISFVKDNEKFREAVIEKIIEAIQTVKSRICLDKLLHFKKIFMEL